MIVFVTNVGNYNLRITIPIWLILKAMHGRYAMSMLLGVVQFSPPSRWQIFMIFCHFCRAHLWLIGISIDRPQSYFSTEMKLKMKQQKNVNETMTKNSLTKFRSLTSNIEQEQEHVHEKFIFISNFMSCIFWEMANASSSMLNSLYGEIVDGVVCSTFN